MTPYSSLGSLVQFSRACGLTIQTKLARARMPNWRLGLFCNSPADGRVGACSMTESGSHANLAFGFGLQIPRASQTGFSSI